MMCAQQQTLCVTSPEHAIAALFDRLILKEKKIAIALSGGQDSMVLLHACFQYLQRHADFRQIARDNFFIFHINHGLHEKSDDWQRFSEQKAKDYGCSFASLKVTISEDCKRQEGIEQAGRKARYAALQDLCKQYEINLLLSAHHRSDQAETLLLQLIRGAGIAGLAAMAAQSHFITNCVLLRPFLSLSKSSLAEYSKAHSIAYVQDESNFDVRYARNRLRLQILPLLETLRPGCEKTLARAAALCAQAQNMFDEVAQEDFAKSQEKHHHWLYSPFQPLACTSLRQLTPARAANLLRYWLSSAGLRLPSQKKLAEMLRQFSISDRATITHDHKHLSVWRQYIWIHSPKTQARQSFCKMWQGESSWELAAWGGHLIFQKKEAVETTEIAACGVAETLLAKQVLHLETRPEKERFRLDPKKSSCSIQHAFQQKNVPPWLRQGPFIYAENSLLWAAYLGWNYAHIYFLNPRPVCEMGIHFLWLPQ